MYLNTTNAIRKLIRSGLCVGLWTLIALPTTVYSQQWQFEPVVNISASYNDNAQLVVDNSAKLDSTAFVLDANGRFVRRAPSSEIRIAPRIRAKTYTDDVFEDTTDFFLDLFAARNLERSNFGLQARFAQEDVGTAEIDDPDFDNPDVTNPVNLDTGRIRIGVNRDSIISSTYFDHAWTEVVGFGIRADYLDVAYDQNQVNLTDYKDTTLGADLTYNMSKRTSLSFGVYASDFEAEDNNSLNESRSVGAILEMRHDFSPTMAGQVQVGYEDVDSDVTDGVATLSESNGATLFYAGITKKGEISRVVLDASQTVDPGGTGFLRERTQFRLRYTRQLSPKMYGNFNARIQITEDVSPDLISPIDRDYQRYSAGLEWRLSQIWSLRGDYTFTSQEFGATTGAASSNGASISFVYNPARRR